MVIVDTHLLISNIIYKYLSNHINFKLNRLAFAYGNIKPDFINKDINRPHTLSESLCCINQYSEKLMEDRITIKKFSLSLGIICHYICDYFCLYHTKGYDKRGIFQHLIYELILHIRLISLLLTGQIRINNQGILGDSVEKIVSKLQNEYKSESENVIKDINYALLAAVQISKLIIYSKNLYVEANGENIFEDNTNYQAK